MDIQGAARPSRRGVLRGGLAAVTGGLVGAGAAAAATVQHQRSTGRLATGGVAADAGSATTTRVLWRAATQEPVLALTFDDGPVERYTRPLLDVLERERVPATFCVLGSRVLEQRELVRREVSGRHELVNHSFDHPDLARLGRTQVRDQLARTDQALADVAGRRAGLVRPPYGRVSGTLLEVAAESGLDVLLWDVQMREIAQTSEQNAGAVLAGLRPGMVLLAHDGGPGPHGIGLGAIPAIIAGARARGFRFVTASELFSLSAPAAAT